jgi:hypothetical protein
MNSHSARFMGPSLALSMILLAAGTALAGGGAAPVEKDTIGVFRSTTDTFYLRNANAAGAAAVTASYGPADSVPLTGDYNSDGTDTIGAYSPSLGRFLLRNTNSEGPANTTVNFGPTNSTLVPLIGDWDGVAADTVGLYERAGGRFLLRNANTNGIATVTTRFGPKGNANVVPIVGNWNGGDTIDGIGLYDPIGGVFLLKNDPTTAGSADLTIRFGPKNSTLIPIVGNWNDDDVDTIGLYNPADGTFLLRNANTAGTADLTFRFGPAGLVPVSGNFNGD